MTKATVLTVDDDENLQTVLRLYLEDAGYVVLSAANGDELKTRLIENRPDVILLDVMLPDSDGFSLIHWIRQQSDTPIIMVSGRGDTTDRIVGLEMGADDYITKPFEMRELSARIKAVLRRAQDTAPAAPGDKEKAEPGGKPEKISFPGWTLDRTQYQAFDANGKSAELTSGEFHLLEALALSANRVLNREQLFDLTRESNYDSYDRAIDIQIGRIRKKLGDDPRKPVLIKTIRGVGYMLSTSSA